MNLRIVGGKPNEASEGPFANAPLAGPYFDPELSNGIVDAAMQFDAIAELLEQTVGHRDELVRWQGDQALGHLQQRLALLVDYDITVASEPVEDSSSLIARADERVLSVGIPLLTGLQKRGVDVERMRTIWAFVAMTLSIGFGIAILSSSYWFALALFTFRIAGSAILGNNAFPAERFRQKSGIPTGSPRSVVNRCIGAHVNDAIVLCSIALALSTSARPLWSTLVIASMIAALLAGVYRSASWQAGAWLRRTSAERWFRIGSVYLGLVSVLAFSSAGVPIDGLPFLALSGLGYLGYAVKESVRTYIAMSNARKHGTIVSMRHRSYGGDCEIKLVA